MWELVFTLIIIKHFIFLLIPPLIAYDNIEQNCKETTYDQEYAYDHNKMGSLSHKGFNRSLAIIHWSPSSHIWEYISVWFHTYSWAVIIFLNVPEEGNILPVSWTVEMSGSSTFLNISSTILIIICLITIGNIYQECEWVGEEYLLTLHGHSLLQRWSYPRL